MRPIATSDAKSCWQRPRFQGRESRCRSMPFSRPARFSACRRHRRSGRRPRNPGRSPQPARPSTELHPDPRNGNRTVGDGTLASPTISATSRNVNSSRRSGDCRAAPACERAFRAVLGLDQRQDPLTHLREVRTAADQFTSSQDRTCRAEARLATSPGRTRPLGLPVQLDHRRLETLVPRGQRHQTEPTVVAKHD